MRLTVMNHDLISVTFLKRPSESGDVFTAHTPRSPKMFLPASFQTFRTHPQVFQQTKLLIDQWYTFMKHCNNQTSGGLYRPGMRFCISVYWNLLGVTRLQTEAVCFLASFLIISIDSAVIERFNTHFAYFDCFLPVYFSVQNSSKEVLRTDMQSKSRIEYFFPA